MANVIYIIIIMIHSRHYMGNRPIHYLRIQILHLRGNIVRQIPGVLKKNRSHYNFHLIGRLFVNHISFRLAPIEYRLSDSVL